MLADERASLTPACPLAVAHPPRPSPRAHVHERARRTAAIVRFRSVRVRTRAPARTVAANFANFRPRVRVRARGIVNFGNFQPRSVPTGAGSTHSIASRTRAAAGMPVLSIAGVNRARRRMIAQVVLSSALDPLERVTVQP